MRPILHFPLLSFMKRIIQTFVEKWLNYILEMLVITAGILPAFALNSWKEQMDDRKLEKSTLIEMRAGLL